MSAFRIEPRRTFRRALAATMRFLDISGFGHSGKTVVSDLLREFVGVQVPQNAFEFNLLRMPGGMIDLRHAMVDNWSPIRADAAIRRFLRLIDRVGPSARLSAPSSIFVANGMNYDAAFAGRFSDLSRAFAASLVDYTYVGEWPYRSLELSALWTGFRRLAQRLRLKRAFLVPIQVAAPTDFDGAARSYLANLFSTIRQDGTEVMVLHNAFEPFHPTSAMEMFPDARQIVVQRDPRDIYASTTVVEGAYRPEFEDEAFWKLKASFLGTSDVERFILRQRIYYRQVQPDSDPRRVLRLRYESIVLDYDASVERIIKFLGLESSAHHRPRAHFDPALSAKNIGLWKRHPRPDEIRRIENALSAFCYGSE